MKNEGLTDRFGGLSGGHGPRRAGFSGGIFPCDAPIGKAELEPGCRTHEITVQAGGAEGGGGDDGRETGIITETRPKVKKPSMYKVLLLNDDYTPMEFVILILVRFFNKSEEDATRIMLHVHQRGVGVCGVYPFEVAETKVTQVVDFARKHQHPLQCTLEKD